VGVTEAGVGVGFPVAVAHLAEQVERALAAGGRLGMMA